MLVWDELVTVVPVGAAGTSANGAVISLLTSAAAKVNVPLSVQVDPAGLALNR